MTILGAVIQGKGEGQRLGYPTANVRYQSTLPPEHGVWVARALVGFRVLRGVAVVGMWDLGNTLPSVEMHLFDCAQDLYGKNLGISLLKKIRDLETFSDDPSLRAQIEKDIMATKEYFAATCVSDL